MGSIKDVVGLWQVAAKREGFKLGVSEHLAAAYTWYQVSHKAAFDKFNRLPDIRYSIFDIRYSIFDIRYSTYDIRYATCDIT